jgi:GNAT superfamily N-acetyltransferase
LPVRIWGIVAVEFRSCQIDVASVERYVEFLRAVFPKSRVFNAGYLDWLYNRNPHGRAIAIDAIDDGVIVAHVALIPFRASLRGARISACLALNVATRSEYQGRGLFRELASRAIEVARQQDVTCVVGVANAQALPIWIRRLGFQDVCGLDARIGLGRFPTGDPALARGRSEFHREWDDEALAWRLSNPNNPLARRALGGDVRILGRTELPLISVQCGLFQPTELVSRDNDAGPVSTLVSVSLGLEPSGSTNKGWSVSIPDWLKPSPLRLIYRNLHHPEDRIDQRAILFRFIDFDPY